MPRRTRLRKELPMTKAAENASEKIDEEKAGRILDTIYEKTLADIPKVSRPVDDLADDYIQKSDSLEKAAKKLATAQIAKCGTSGFIAGLGGLITLPVAIPANLSSVLYVQMRMIAAIAKIGGYDPKTDQVQTMAYICLTGSAASNIVKDAGIKIGEKNSRGRNQENPKSSSYQNQSEDRIQAYNEIRRKGGHQPRKNDSCCRRDYRGKLRRRLYGSHRIKRHQGIHQARRHISALPFERWDRISLKRRWQNRADDR